MAADKVVGRGVNPFGPSGSGHMQPMRDPYAPRPTTYADETSLTIAADDLTRALDELQRETRPGHCDDTGDLARAYMACQLAGYRLNEIRAQIMHAYRDAVAAS